ncbi:MAG: biopolymer transporter ExbD [Planctomycetes bacterium]|nr:biopolymer transporter ExbD [Planctomycetota bacterium]
MTRKKPIDEKVELNMTPMIDVTFQLLIFFIVTMKFRLLEKKLVTHLPTDFGLTPGSPVEENFVTVKLRQRRVDPERSLIEQPTEILVEGQVLGERELLDRLARFRLVVTDAYGKIDAGPGVPHGQVVGVIDLFNRAGFDRVSFVGLQGLRSGSELEALGLRLRSELAAPLH